MTTSSALSAPLVPEEDILRLLAVSGGRPSFLELRLAAAALFGHAAYYAGSNGEAFGFEGLLRHLESQGKIVREGDDVILRAAPPRVGD